MSLRIVAVAATLASLLGAPAALAQDYPTQPIRLILGPSPEATPRFIAERLQKELGQPVVVEPRLGAGGEIAAKAVSGSDADGCTLLYASSNFSLATAMQLGSFDFAKDFEPVALVGTSADRWNHDRRRQGRARKADVTASSLPGSRR